MPTKFAPPPNETVRLKPIQNTSIRATQGIILITEYCWFLCLLCLLNFMFLSLANSFLACFAANFYACFYIYAWFACWFYTCFACWFLCSLYLVTSMFPDLLAELFYVLSTELYACLSSWSVWFLCLLMSLMTFLMLIACLWQLTESYFFFSPTFKCYICYMSMAVINSYI